MIKKYRIETLNDIAEVVTEDNIEDFIADFKEWLRFQIVFKKESNVQENIKCEVSKAMIWIDDKNPGNFKGVNIEIINENK